MSNIKLYKYSEYKLSGVQWIGNIPRNWKIYKLKHIKKDIKYSIVDGPFGTQLHSDEYTEKGIPVLRVTNLTYQGKFCSENLVYISDEKYRTLKRSSIGSRDVLIAKTGATIGKVGVPNNIDKAIISSSCLKISINDNVNSDFVKYLLISDSGQSQILYEAAGSTRDTINIEPFSNLFFPFPARDEQDAIVNFLDKKVAEIDTLIKKDKKLIELLLEKRTALINHVITKGLNPNARMREVNLLTCGETPQEWDVLRIKNVLRLSRGVDLSEDRFEEGNIPVYGSNGLIGFHNKFTGKSPSITVGRSGSVGEINYIDNEKYWAHNTCLFLQDNYGNNVRYIFYLLSILDLKHLAAGSAVGTLNRNYIHDLYVSLPSKLEQQKIANYLDKQTSKIDKTIQKIQRKINLLEEYKKSLIHHVVTGKVDVRSVKI